MNRFLFIQANNTGLVFFRAVFGLLIATENGRTFYNDKTGKELKITEYKSKLGELTFK
ncbi:MAG: hypothetical protein JJE55_03200 [Flavobacteriaceae bacterium]|nr:hypothetical protein [Flavobacteriaceae bacterium]